MYLHLWPHEVILCNFGSLCIFACMINVGKSFVVIIKLDINLLVVQLLRGRTYFSPAWTSFFQAVSKHVVSGVASYTYSGQGITMC